MPTPFPGMDPYLEAPDFWQGFHNRLIARMADDLAPRLRPRYFVATEVRIYQPFPGENTFIGRPDVTAYERSDLLLHELAPSYDAAPIPRTVMVPRPDEMGEAYLEIRRVGRSKKVVTVVELLSPANKRWGHGNEVYLQKRANILTSNTHLVEIDLLREGAPMPLHDAVISDYRILVSRAEKRPRADLYDFSVRQPIPSFPLPLLPDDEEPLVNLNHILHALYDQAGYDLEIDYRRDAEPPLHGEDVVWAADLLRTAGLRP